MSTPTASDFLIRRINEWGLKRIYGYPGDGINGIMGALDRANGAVEYVQVRHEEMAAFMACAHAKFTGEVGICLATSGPGAIHLLNGLYDAKMDHASVVAIVGQQARAAIRHLIDRAIRIAKAERTVTCIIIPNDVQEMPAVETPPRKHGTVHSGIGYASPHVVPKDVDLRRAAEILNAGEKVAMLVGAGALQATDEVIEAADILGAGVAKALLGKAAIPDDLSFCTGPIGLLGSKPSWDMMEECDTLLVVGSSFPYSEFLPKEGQARGVQIDLDGRMLGIRYPMEVNLVGDSAETLRALMPYLKRKQNRSWRQQIDKAIQEWQQVLEAQAAVEAKPVNPAYLYSELNKRLPDGAIFSADSGSTATWYARYLKFRKGMMGSLSGNLATMGPAMPYAVAAKLAYPDRPVFALVGDGATQMNGMN